MIALRLAVITATVVALGTTALAAASAQTGPGPQPSPTGTPTAGTPMAQQVLKLAVEGSRGVDYEGTQSISIRGQQGVESGTLHVAKGPGDRMIIEAEPSSGSSGWLLVQQGNERMTMSMHGTSITQAQSPLVSDIEPDAGVAQLLRNYAVALEGGAQMLDRQAWVLDIKRTSDARLVERWTVDAVTGLLLDRQSFDPNGQVERSIAFTQVREPYSPPAADLQPPVKVPGWPPRAAPAGSSMSAGQLTRLARTAGLPASLPGGFVLQSGAQVPAPHGSVVQLVYFDGLEDLSLFQQPGLLSRSTVPAGAGRIRLARETGYLWQGFPRGAAWQAGTNTDTLLGDSPTDELTTIANSLPQAKMQRSLPTRLKHLADWVQDHLGLGSIPVPRRT